jgi:hypothetical protein
MPNSSVRINAVGEHYTRSLSPTIGTAFTICGWARLAVDRNSFQTIWCMDSGSFAGAVALQTASDGTTLRVVSGGGTSHVVTTLTPGVWYCFASTRSATGGAVGSVNLRYGTDPAALTTWAMPSGFGEWSTQATFEILRLGESIWAPEWINGNLAFVKVYTRALSAGEITTELNQYNPSSTDSLYAAYSFWDGPTTADISGNGRTLTGGTGTSAEAGPVGIPQAVSTGPEPGRFLLAY